jgi:Na+/H+-dicarboxylate symporter
MQDPAPPKPGTDDSLVSKLFAAWHGVPLYLRILGAVILGVLVGVLLGPNAAPLQIPSRLVLRLLGALAAPLILMAVINAFLHVEFPKGTAAKLISLLLFNTVVAIFIGLLVANTLQPGRWGASPEKPPAEEEKSNAGPNPILLILENVPKSVLGPLTDDGRVLSVVFLAVAFGFALRKMRDERLVTVADFVDVTLRTLVTTLHWIVEVVPLAVFGVVASIVGQKGFGDFVSLFGLVISVLVALLLQLTYYLLFIRLASWPSPLKVIAGMRDALVMAFSTASSTVTMPLTYESLRKNVGLRERSANLGALVGANFNNDGTALYEAMAALFVSQLLGQHLSLSQQGVLVVMAVIASVGAAGIPEAGLVTMTAVFNSVGLPVEYIPMLLTVDWFLDRCRTAMNVMGDVTVSCVLDGKTPETADAEDGVVPADSPQAVVPPAIQD